MRGNPVLQIVTNGDMICKKCPNSKENTCITQEKVKIYDQKVLAACELSKGVTLSWEEFSFLVEERILKKENAEKSVPTASGMKSARERNWNDMETAKNAMQPEIRAAIREDFEICPSYAAGTRPAQPRKTGYL